jgi:outer membrane receptor protein involved in Fe transport
MLVRNHTAGIFRRATLSGAVAAALAPCPALAQEADEAVVEEIVVTGSRIPRRDFGAPSPITTVDRDTLVNSGQPTLEESLNQMPQISPDFGRTSNNPGNGKSLINLRGLGSNRTLVMLNGRRLAPSGVGSSVDVNTLPQVMIDRVEVITGGATTVYGSDAVAGVVNFITRDDFDGFGLDTSAYVTGEGDSEVYDLNITWGHNFANGRGNITVFGGYLDRHESFAGDREITAVPLFDTWEGEIVEAGSPTIPEGVIFFPEVDFGNGPAATTFTPDGVPREFIDPDDRYNYAPANYLQVPLERYSGGMFLDYQLSERIEGYAELTYTRNVGKQTLAPVPAFELATTNLDNPALSAEASQVFADNYIPDPNDPNLVSFFIARRMEEVGPRIADTTNDYYRVVAGLRGFLNDTWDYDVWATYTKGEEEELLLNDVSRTSFLQGLLVDPVSGECFDTSRGCVPVNMFGAGNISAEAVEFLRLPPAVNTANREQKLVSAFVRGDPFSTWAGPVSIAVGAEWRSDSGDFEADESLFSGDAMGFSGASSVNGRESVSEIYAEALVPLADNAPFARYLAVEFGGRLSEYDNAGSVDTFKVGGDWEPVAGLRFRTMFQRSVRAPDLTEAFQEQRREPGSFVNNNNVDPCSASEDPVANGNVEKCVLQGIPEDQVGVFEATPFFPTTFVSGGNPEIVPETAKTWTAGIVYTGFDSWVLSVDFFDLRVDDTIGGADAAFVCFDAKNTENVLCNDIIRDPNNYNVVEVIELASNVGSFETSGVDVQLSYATEVPALFGIGGSYADLSVDLVWTHLLELEFQDNPAVDPIDCVGAFGFTCEFSGIGTTFPSDRVTTNINYLAGNWDMHLTWRWIADTDNDAERFAEIIGFEDPIVSVPSTGNVNYLDFGLGYRITDNFSARLSIANLLDEDPPLMADGAISNNTDDRMFDIFGRSYQLTLQLRY